jgi:hypothetical protein
MYFLCYNIKNEKEDTVMATPTKEGIKAEIDHHERELDRAINNGDEKMIAYHNERIRRLKIELENLK